jgi:hypothetical protein
LKLENEIKLLDDMDRAMKKNNIKQILESLGLTIGASLFGFMIGMMIVLLGYLGYSAVTQGVSPKFVFQFVIFGVLLGLIMFIETTSSMTLSLSETERDFLFTKPISIKGILLQRILRKYRWAMLIFFVAYIILVVYSVVINYIHILIYLRAFYALFTFSIIITGYFPLWSNFKEQLPSNKNLDRAMRIMGWITSLAILELIILVFYLLFYYIMGESFINFFSQPPFNLIGIYYPPNDPFEMFLGIPPLNVILLLPLSTAYICLASSYDIFFWLAVLGNGIFAYFIYRWSLSYNYIYYTDYRELKEEIEAEDKLWEEITKEEEPVDIITFKKRREAKDQGEPLKDVEPYPELKPGPMAIFELGLIINRRETYGLMKFLNIFILIFVFAFLILSFPSNMMGLILFGAFGFFLLFCSMSLKIKRYDFFKLLPVKGFELMIYGLLPFIIYYIIGFFGLLCFFIIAGILYHPAAILMYFFVGGILLVGVPLSSEVGYYIFAEPNKMMKKDGMGSVGGAFQLGLITILFTLALYILVSSYITSAWKFLLIGLGTLGLIGLFIMIYAKDYDHWGSKKRNTKRRSALATILLFLLIISIISDLSWVERFAGEEFMGMDDTPRTWAWKVDGDESIQNQVVYFDDNIFITSSGELEIYNSTIIFECSPTNIFGLYLSSGGRLEIENCTLTVKYHNLGFLCKLYGKANIVNTTLEYLWATGRFFTFSGGLEIYSSDVLIDNCKIINSRGNGVTIEDASPIITHSTIRDSGDDGIDMEDSNAVVFNCTIINNYGDGVYIDDGSAKVINCTFNYNFNFGIKVSASRYEIKGNSFLGNGNGNSNKKLEY